MKIPASSLTIQPTSPTPALPGSDRKPPLDLRPGQVVQATVLHSDGDSALLELGRHQVRAESRLPLHAGEQLSLRVTSTAPHIELQRLVTPQDAGMTTLLQLLVGQWRQFPNMHKLIQLLKNGATGWNETTKSLLAETARQLDTIPLEADGQSLAVLLENLGVVLQPDQQDSRATLQWALQQAAASLAGEESGGGPEGRELQQLLDHARSLNLQLLPEGALLLPLPLPFLKRGLLLVEQSPSGRRQDGEKPCRLSLFLDLTELGEMRVDVLWAEGDILVKFTCARDETAALLEAWSGDLRQRLEAEASASLLFAVGDVAPGEELLRKLRPEGQGLLDTRI